MMPENERPNIDAQYIPERRTVEVLKILKDISDEKNPVSKKDVSEHVFTTSNPQTLSNTIDEILKEINPPEYEDNDDEYRIKYNGYDKPYDDNPLAIKDNITELRKQMRRKGADTEAIAAELGELGKAPTISGLRYIHDFSYEDMDDLISAVVLSASIPSERKEHLIKRILSTASKHYKTPFYDQGLKKLLFNPYAVYSRLSDKTGENARRIGQNVRILQEAMRLRAKVSFNFDVIGADKEYITDNTTHIISPYYIVIYHDMYYVIGAWDKGNNACHYRIDLMSSLSIVKDKKGKIISMRAMSECKDLPNRDREWDPEKYMSEHLYMAYNTDHEKPRRISIKIPTEKINRYTILHDWFGRHFSINKSVTAKCEEGYEVVDVVSSPTMLAHWAMQYADFCEVLDEEVREKIKIELKTMEMRYEKND
ncbi:MAG: WYL domain-containing protein [Lachnospiraceae bacterium]|nr:WYL domain-containing protein [Lachnospiraceae bacterium]